MKDRFIPIFDNLFNIFFFASAAITNLVDI